jgi:CheY-like chemotaxis protein
MFIVIYNNESDFAIRLPSDKFKTINVKRFYSLVDKSDYLFNENLDEFYAHKISEHISLAENIDAKAIIIDKDLGELGRSVLLAGHIACNNFFKCPIILTDFSEINIEDSCLKSNILNNIFQTDGFYFRNYERLFSISDDLFSGEKKFGIELEIDKLKPISIKDISISPKRDSTHQSTNEWGAMRLASNFGLMNNVKFNYPKHLYFKYIANFLTGSNEKMDLEAGKNAKADESLHNLYNKILLIDDNADLGWKELLEKIFKSTVVIKKNNLELLALKNVNPDSYKEYDLVFLDLYLDKMKSDYKDSIDTLNYIKAKFPQVPVVIFTASDKASKLNEILENGADGMYTKESPLYFKDSAYSTANFEDFKKTCIFVSEKYKVLKPYWVNIQSILSNPTFKNIINSNDRKCKSRIEERLKMFYGLLKKGYEQRNYDKRTFYYSDNELAFMTLWSVLNEIQEAFFTKTIPELSINLKSGVTVTHHPNGDKLKYSENDPMWKLNGKTFLSYDNYNLEYIKDEKNVDTMNPVIESGRYLLRKGKKSSQLIEGAHRFNYSEFVTNKYVVADKRQIATQIAFILFVDASLKKSLNQLNYLNKLDELNEIRNKLYFTHGGDFKYTLEEMRNDMSFELTDKIKDLFNLIAFLLTADESTKIY